MWFFSEKFEFRENYIFNETQKLERIVEQRDFECIHEIHKRNRSILVGVVKFNTEHFLVFMTLSPFTTSLRLSNHKNRIKI